MFYEAARNLGLLQQRARADLSDTLNAALDEGRALAARDYRAAHAARERTVAALCAWLAPFDAIVTPPTPAAAPAGITTTGDPSCCTLWSLAGFPAITIPIALDAAGLPLGLQLAAPSAADDRLLAVAAWCETQLPFAAWPG